MNGGERPNPKESPILMTDDMVRAILAKRKRVTRRPITSLLGFGRISEFGRSDTPGYVWAFRDAHGRWNDIDHERLLQACPFGGPGDRLWVREAWNVYEKPDEDLLWPFDVIPKTRPNRRHTLVYRASDEGELDWRPNIHMPRWACRLVLSIVLSRPECLLDVTNEEALLEGARWMDFGGDNFGQQRPGWSMCDPFPTSWEDCLPSARAAFGNYVNECYAGPRWDLKPDGDLMAANPWVWRIEFDPKRMRRYER